VHYNVGYDMINGFTSVGDYVYSEIRKLIINWDLKPGQRVSEAEMSKILNVSRTPVREAFIQLKIEELVMVLPQRGTFVTKVNIEKVKEGLFIRSCLESEVLAEVSGKLTDEQINQVQGYLDSQEEALKDGDAKKFYMYDLLFHKAFFDFANHKHTWDFIDHSNSQSERVSMFTLLDFDRFETVLKVHKQLFQALVDDQPKMAKEITKSSIFQLLEEVEPLKEKHPEYFD